MSKTNEKTKEVYQAGGVLPPLCLLQESGEAMVGILNQVDGGTDERTFYRFKLLESVKADTNDAEDVTFEAGDVVTLPSTGHLDYLLKDTVKHYTDSLEVSELVGYWFRIKRIEDGKLAKGKFKGKTVKNFRVEACKEVPEAVNA